MGRNFSENLRKELDYQGLLVKELSAKTDIPVATLDCYLVTVKTTASTARKESAVNFQQN